jgi:hypothetical protein
MLEGPAPLPPCTPIPRQLPLPFPRGPASSPQPIDLVTLPLPQIWPSLPLSLRTQVRRTLLRVLQEALDDTARVTTSELP